jgi:hypothetical protein
MCISDIYRIDVRSVAARLLSGSIGIWENNGTQRLLHALHFVIKSHSIFTVGEIVWETNHERRT